MADDSSSFSSLLSRGGTRYLKMGGRGQNLSGAKRP